MVKTEPTPEEQIEIDILNARMKADKQRIQEILQNVQIKNLPADANEGKKDFYEQLLSETKHDILIEEMVPPEALNFDKLTDDQKTAVVKNTKEEWCLVHNRMEEKP